VEYPFNYADAIKGRHMEQNIDVEDGDIIIVPPDPPLPPEKKP